MLMPMSLGLQHTCRRCILCKMAPLLRTICQLDMPGNQRTMHHRTSYTCSRGSQDSPLHTFWAKFVVSYTFADDAQRGVSVQHGSLTCATHRSAGRVRNAVSQRISMAAVTIMPVHVDPTRTTMAINVLSNISWILSRPITVSVSVNTHTILLTADTTYVGTVAIPDSPNTQAICTLECDCPVLPSATACKRSKLQESSTSCLYNSVYEMSIVWPCVPIIAMWLYKIRDAYDKYEQAHRGFQVSSVIVL
jgi:hypothetical protein